MCIISQTKASRAGVVFVQRRVVAMDTRLCVCECVCVTLVSFNRFTQRESDGGNKNERSACGHLAARLKSWALLALVNALAHLGAASPRFY